MVSTATVLTTLPATHDGITHSIVVNVFAEAAYPAGEV